MSETATTTDIKEITKELGEHHAEKATSTKALEGDRKKFFSAASLEVSKKALATKIVDIPDDAEDIGEWIKTYHPGWKIISLAANTRATLEEDPSLRSYTYVNEEDSKVYIRNAIPGAQYLDDQALASDYPDVWKRIAIPVRPDWENVLDEFCTSLVWDYNTSSPHGRVDDLMIKFIDNHIAQDDWPRKLIDFEEMSSEDLDVVSEYLVPGPISLRLEVRDAKPEELEEANEDHD